MAEVTLLNEKKEVLIVNIKDKQYSIPLSGSIPYSKLKSLKTDEAMCEFYKEYIPEEVFDTLLTADIYKLTRAWNKASTETQGLTVGE